MVVSVELWPFSSLYEVNLVVSDECIEMDVPHKVCKVASQKQRLKGQRKVATSLNMCRGVCRSEVQKAAQSALLPVFALCRSGYLNIRPLGVIMSFRFH